MRQRFVAAIGAIVTIGLFLVTYAKRAADTISIIHLPHDVEELLTSMSQTPVLISYGALTIGLICLAYLAISPWWPSKPKPPAPDKASVEPTAVLSPKQKNDLDFLLHTLSTKLGWIEHQLGAFDKFQSTRWTKELGQHRFEMDQIRRGINDANGDIFFHFLPENREYFSYIIKVLKNDEMLAAFHPSATEYLEKLGVVRPVDQERVAMVDAANEHLIKSAADVREWLSGARTRLREMRASLR